MTVDEILADVRWFSQWVNPAGQVRFCVRPVSGTGVEQFTGKTPSEALEKMRAANAPPPNEDLF